VARAADLAEASRLIEQRCRDLLGAGAAVVQEPPAGGTPGDRPEPAGTAGETRIAGLPPAARALLQDNALPDLALDTRRTRPSTPVWPAQASAAAGFSPGDHLAVALGEHAGRDWRLLLPGRWESRRARLLVSHLRESLTAALAAPALRARATHAEHVVAAAFAFSRGLTRIHGAGSLRQFVVDTMAQSTRARLAALALYEDAEGSLRLVATHGYPAVFVEHVRVAPGEGIIGQVFESRRPLLVGDIRQIHGLQRRPRYRTSSCLAVPLLAKGEVLGVVTFADRADGEAFDEGDLTTARALAAPAALALLNDRLADQGRQLAHAATVDPLTGLFNRRHFHTRIEEEIERARRYSLDLALLLIDIDDFKQINDTLGHLAGDYLLRQVAEVLKRSVRVFDVCTRYGGEEFAILMPGSSAANAMVVAERIRARVESASRDDGPLPPYLRITVSLGLAVLGTESASQELIARADRALYRAKAEGKNRVAMD
jgi:diguanylate cyclase (GGDEF)-like protein